MSVGSEMRRGRRSVRVAVVVASTAVALCFAAAVGLVQEPLNAAPAKTQQAHPVSAYENPAD